MRESKPDRQTDIYTKINVSPLFLYLFTHAHTPTHTCMHVYTYIVK